MLDSFLNIVVLKIKMDFKLTSDNFKVYEDLDLDLGSGKCLYFKLKKKEASSEEYLSRMNIDSLLELVSNV